VARELLLRGDDRVVLIDPSPGGGVAYGAAAGWHLLNSPAGSMSADPDDRGHFVTWCRRRGLDVRPADFVPRPVYGEYLADVLRDASAPGRLIRRHARAVRVRPAVPGLDVLLDDGGVVVADQVVLALGQAPPRDPWAVDPGCRRYVRNPWGPGALDGLPDDGPVLLLGTGLTAIDVALTLTRSPRRWPMLAMSRHGLVPQPHRTSAATGAVPTPSPNLSTVMRQVRRLAAEAPDWRGVVDGLRPHMDTLWHGLTPAARDRFVRHVARVWEVHRHRIAPSVAARLDDLRASGALRIRAGRVNRVTPVDERGLEVDGRHADGTPLPTRFAAVVNCTGPGRLPDCGDPLVAALFADGLGRPGPMGLGFDTTACGALVGRDGHPSPGLWTLGPPRRGTVWETTALAEIRAQAHALAVRLTERVPVALPA
jgi:uncharacterized NAD(P)/FAD-binding protein YdhS